MTHGSLLHVGVAVENIDHAVATYRSLCPDITIGPRIKVAEQGIEVCFLDFPSTAERGRIELLADLEPGGKLSKFIARRGEGVHHLCFSCENLIAKLSELSAKGFTLIDTVPRLGALGRPIAFVHPSSTHGVLVEFEEEPPR